MYPYGLCVLLDVSYNSIERKEVALKNLNIVSVLKGKSEVKNDR